MNMRIAYLGLKPGRVKKPPPFTLQDLPKYSRTLKIKNTQFNQVLKKKQKEESKEPISPPKSPMRNIEWTKTPVYK